jgi:hypothetical protein
MKRAIVMLAVAIASMISTCGQGFLNLNFESAQNVPGSYPNQIGVAVPCTNALPGWIAYDGNFALTSINYISNYFSGNATSIELEGGSLALSGNFSVGVYGDGSISQTGLVPGGAESLQFEGNVLPQIKSSGFSVSLGGQTLSYSLLSEGPDYYVYGANIPASMDGQVESLTFGCQGVGSGLVILDNIEFSTMGVPEPSEWALIGVGAVMVALRSGFFIRRWRRFSQMKAPLRG